MTKEINNGFEVVNYEKFEDFLKEKGKREFDLDACYDELERNIMEFESHSCELSPFFTKSGHAECISYDYEYLFEATEGEWVTKEELYERFPEAEICDYDYKIIVTF